MSGLKNHVMIMMKESNGGSQEKCVNWLNLPNVLLSETG